LPGYLFLDDSQFPAFDKTLYR